MRKICFKLVDGIYKLCALWYGVAMKHAKSAWTRAELINDRRKQFEDLKAKGIDLYFEEYFTKYESKGDLILADILAFINSLAR